MPAKPIDLDALERVLGKPPARAKKGSTRNLLRALWFNHAVASVAELARRVDTRFSPGRARRRVFPPIFRGDPTTVTVAGSPRRVIPTNPRKRGET